MGEKPVREASSGCGNRIPERRFLMIINMPANSFFLYYIGYLGQAILVVAAGIYLYIKDSKSD